MSYACVRGKAECDGCMMCEKELEALGYCAECDEPVYVDQEHYDIEGELVHDECLTDWAKKYLVKG